jgi:hypothetical protein
MRLLDLQLELLHEVLRWALQVRGVERGLRLRLVNSHFCLMTTCIPTHTYPRGLRYRDFGPTCSI